MPYLAAARTPFRLCRQPGLQQQTGSGACLGTIFPYQPGRIRPDYRKSTRLSETSVTKPTANLRKPYGTSVRELRRYASFIGTSNQKDLLTDPTGSRRFICIEVTDPIDTNVTIDYRQLYAQAMHLLYKNERYWLNDEDEAVLRQSNSEFEQISPLEHLFHCNFSSATNEKEGEWMTAMDIFNYLQENTRDKLSINKINWFGRILRKLNIPKKTSTRGTLYHVTKLK